MKKLILLLALALGVEVKGQIVGGFLPRNSSTSTATIGTIRTNSLVVTANTISVGAKTLTAGNTGTVAVLSDAVFAINFQWQGSTPADGATYTISTHPLVLSSSTSKQYIPVACELFSVTTNYYFGSLGTTEVATLQLCQNTTVTDITTFTTSGANYLEQGVSQAVNFSAGDRIAILLKAPTFATNPTVTYGSVMCWFRRRS